MSKFKTNFNHSFQFSYMGLEEIERLPKERLVQQRTPVQQIVNSLGYKQRWALPIGFR
jgi:hypothetical protein